MIILGQRYMPSRKVFTNGWVFWLARHPEHGLLLFDKADQEGMPAGNVQVFILKSESRCTLPLEALKSETSGEVTAEEFALIVTAYNAHKLALGKPLKAPSNEKGASLEERHSTFLLTRGLPNNGLRPATSNRYHRRVTHCWSCKEHLDNSVNVECATCGWIICNCGACGCGK